MWMDQDLPLMLKEEEMVKNVVYYIVIMQGKKQTRKVDILKLAMNKQSKDFPKVIRKVGKGLLRLFGLHLIGLKNGPEGQPVKCELLEASSFLTLSKFRQSVIAATRPDQTFLTDLPKAALLLILTYIYMSDKSIDEEHIWIMLEKMEIAAHLCKRKEDLRRFLRTDYVEPLYLLRIESKEPDNTVYYYEWGIRAEIEVCKFALLKYVSQVLGKRPNDFVNQISKIPLEEIERIDEEDRRGRDQESASVNESMAEGRGDDSSQLMNESVLRANNTSTQSRRSQNDSQAANGENSEDED